MKAKWTSDSRMVPTSTELCSARKRKTFLPASASASSVMESNWRIFTVCGCSQKLVSSGGMPPVESLSTTQAACRAMMETRTMRGAKRPPRKTMRVQKALSDFRPRNHTRNFRLTGFRVTAAMAAQTKTPRKGRAMA